MSKGRKRKFVPGIGWVTPKRGVVWRAEIPEPDWAVDVRPEEPPRSERDKAVGVGMAIAAGIIMQHWGDDTQAEEILRAAGLITVKELREAGVDWYDIRFLAPVLRAIKDRAESR